MRLGYLVPEFPGQTHAFFWRELQALRAEGHDVVPISTRRPSPDACRHAFGEIARAQTVYLVPPSPASATGAVELLRQGRRVWDYFRAASYTGPRSIARVGVLMAGSLQLRRVCRNLEVEHLHVHSCANAAHVAALARLLGGPPYSLTLHGDLDVYGDAHDAKFRHARFVSVVTAALQDQVVERLGVNRTRLPVIRMGVDTDAFRPVEKPPMGERVQALTVARLNRTKGHVHALDAIAALRTQGITVDYKIAGTGPEEAAIRRKVDDLGLSSQVTLLGNVSESQVRLLLGEADIFLLTSFGQGEAAPVSVMEAMAAGVPVICSRIGGTPEMIEDGDNGLLVDQRDSAGIARAIQRLKEDHDLRLRLVERGRVRAQAEFDYRVNARALMAQIEGAQSTPDAP